MSQTLIQPPQEQEQQAQQRTWSLSPEARAQFQAGSAPVQQQAQEQQGEITVEGEPGVIGTIKDTLFGLASSPAKFLDSAQKTFRSTYNYLVDAEKWAWDKLTGDGKVPAPEMKAAEPYLQFHNIDPSTPFGKVAEGISEYATGFIIAGNALKTANILQKSTVGSTTFRPMVQGALADFNVNAQEKRLSNIIEDIPALRNPLTAWLAAEEDDGFLEGKAKNVIEGMALGVFGDILFASVKALRAIKSGKSMEEAARIVEAAQSPKVSAAIEDSSVPKAPEVNNVDMFIKQVHAAKSTEDAITGITDSVNFNRMVWESPQGSNALKNVSDALADKTLKAAGPEKHAALLREVVDDFSQAGVDLSAKAAKLREAGVTLKEIAKEFLAGRMQLVQMTSEATRLADRFLLGNASPVEQARLFMLAKNTQELHLALADVRTSSGRLLSSHNVEADEGLAKAALGDGEDFYKRFANTAEMTGDDAKAWLSKNGISKGDLEKLSRQLQAASGDPLAQSRILQNTKKGLLSWATANEVFTNALLSGPKSWFFNGITPGLKTLGMPLERMIGGMLTLDSDAVKSGFRLYRGLSQNFMDTLRMTGKTFKTSRNVLDSAASPLEAPTHQLSYENMRQAMLKNAPEGAELTPWQELQARAFGLLGNTINFPSRIMMTTDEFWKQINFRAHLFDKLYQQAEERGLRSGDEIKAYINAKTNEAFAPNGAVARGELTADSLLYAQEATWTQPLNGGIGGTIQDAVIKSPSLRFILPFVKTPTNIIRDFNKSNPLTAWMFKDVREKFRAGGEARAEALGKVAMGSIITCAAVSLAERGLITGSLPKDPKLRKALLETGWEPYSIYDPTTGKYWSYRRVDPVGMFFGIVADVYGKFVNGVERGSEMGLDEAGLACLGIAVHNLGDKTWLQGVSEFVGWWDDPESSTTRFFGRTASSRIPLSGMLRQMRQIKDSHMREMDSFMDYVRNTVPGGSDALPAKRSWITGQIIDYRLISGLNKQDMVLDELLRLGKGIPGEPQHVLNGIKLSASQYADLCELHGTVKIRGMTMHQKLERLFKSPDYDLERKYKGDSPAEFDKNPRSLRVEKIIDLYRKAAKQHLLRRHPDLKKQLDMQRVKERAARAGFLRKDNEPAALQRIQNLMRY